MSENKYPRAGGVFYACFNSRTSDQLAGRKAVIETFGLEQWKDIVKINRNGLLSMFHVAPTPATELYANVIAERVERRYEKEDRWFCKQDEESP